MPVSGRSSDTPDDDDVVIFPSFRRLTGEVDRLRDEVVRLGKALEVIADDAWAEEDPPPHVAVARDALNGHRERLPESAGALSKVADAAEAEVERLRAALTQADALLREGRASGAHNVIANAIYPHNAS